MRIFVCEYCCAVEPTSSLRAEGWAMLSAIVADFCALPNVEVWTLLGEGCKSLGHRCERVAPDEEPEHFRRLARQADATLVIAPETAGILAERSRWAWGQDSNPVHLPTSDRIGLLSPHLGSDPASIDLTADKRALAEHFAQAGVPTPRLWDTPTFPGTPVVLKPRDGAGSQATFLIRSAADWNRCLQEARAALPGSEFLVQTYVHGLAASVTFLIGRQQTIPLLPATQHLSNDGRFRYGGGRLPLPKNLAQRAVTLATQAISGIQGLFGFVGVDIVLAEDPKDDVVIEINPRLTTSYLGLRRLAKPNLAAELLRIARGEEVSLTWREGTVEFHADRYNEENSQEAIP